MKDDNVAEFEQSKIDKKHILNSQSDLNPLGMLEFSNEDDIDMDDVYNKSGL